MAMIPANYRLRQLYSVGLLWVGPFVFVAALSLRGPAGAGWWLAALATTAVLTVYGYNVGSHYAFTHRLFRFPRPVELFLIYASTISACASPIAWAVQHNAHHRHADTEHDPHAPSVLGWRALFVTAHNSDRASPLSARHLLADPAQRFADSDLGFWVITLSWPAIAALVGGLDGLLYLWLAPVWYVLAVTMVFIFSHVGPHDPISTSRAVNSVWLAVLSLGDGGHLNHHRNPRACGDLTRVFAALAGGEPIIERSRR